MKTLRCFVAILVAVAAIAAITRLVKATPASPSSTWFEITPSAFAFSISDTLTVTVVLRYDGEGCQYSIYQLGLYQNSGAEPSLEFISPPLLGPGGVDVTSTFTLRAVHTGTSELFASAYGEYGGPPECPWVWRYLNSVPITVIVGRLIHREYLPVIKK
jgi:hypothetical protein